MKSQFKIWTLILIAVSFMSLQSCTKEAGPVGSGEITGTATMAGSAIEGAYVKIAYGATEATDAFDDVTVTMADGSFTFAGIAPGDYYVDAVYTDDNDIEFNTAGYLVTVGGKKSSVNLDIELK